MLNDIGASGINIFFSVFSKKTIRLLFILIFFLDDGNVSFEDFVSLMYAISIIAEIADDPVSESESKKNFSVKFNSF
jgi:hypothetical protein